MNVASVKSLFNYLNDNCKYLVLRNWDNIFMDSINTDGHEDIDIMCYSLSDFVSLTGATRIHNEKTRDNFVVHWDGDLIRFDVRWVGDGYYPKLMEIEMLNNRVLNNQNIYVPVQKDYYYSLLYHALIQKPYLSEEYKNKLNLLRKQFGDNDVSLSENDLIQSLQLFIKDNNMRIVLPRDPGVFLNKRVMSGFPVEINLYRCLNRQILGVKQYLSYIFKHISHKLNVK